ncbi:MAG TPA: FtsX-like permease family protein [Acidimicrobiales bacterium]|nr:FtsX-like permease family protein [Acidimicrobiales bacterium]
MLETTLAGLRARKRRVLTTSFAVLLGVAFMAGSLVLTDTIGKTFDTMFADIYAGTDAYVRGEAPIESEMGDDSRTRLDESVLATVAGVDGVAVAEPNVQGYAQIVGTDGNAVGNPNQGAPTFGGNWSDDAQLNPFDIVEGRAPRADDEVVIDKLSAERGKLAVGATTTVLVKTGAEPVKVVGITKFGELDSPGGASFVGFTLATAERVITAPGTFNGVSVVAENGVSQTAVRDRIADALGDRGEVLTGRQLTNENQNDIKQGLGFFTTFIVTFAAIALIVGSFIISNTFSIIVAQRTRETALLRAIGASRRQVLGSILLEASVVGVVASVLGVVGGIGMAQLLKALLAGFGFDLPAGGVVLSMRTVVTCFIVGVGVSVTSAVFPARRASRVPPVEAMRMVAVEASQSSRTRLVSGVVLTALGGGLIALGLVGSGGVKVVGMGVPLTFLGVAVLGRILAKPATRALGAPLPSMRAMPGTLARNNASRNPKRTSATASALMIGVGLVTFIAVMATSAKSQLDKMVDQDFGADLVIPDSGLSELGGFSPSLAASVAALPEVGSVGAVRTAAVEIDGKADQGKAIDPIAIPRVFDFGVVAGDLGALDATHIAVQDSFRDGKVALGDVVPVRFAETGDQKFTVAAIYSKGHFGQAMFGTSAWEANVADQFDSTVYVLARDGVALSDAKAAVERVAAPYPTAKVQDLGEFKEAQSARINQLLGLIYALLGLAVLIAVLGIANTLALSIFERTRELGLLRAVGMTRAQLRSSVRWESVLIAQFGTALGVVVGVTFGSALMLAVADEGLGAVVVPGGQLVVIAVLAALCGVLAAVLPARRASKLDVLAAIAAP